MSDFIAYYVRLNEVCTNLPELTIPDLKPGEELFSRYVMEDIRDFSHVIQVLYEKYMGVSREGFRIYPSLDDAFENCESTFIESNVTIYEIRAIGDLSKKFVESDDGKEGHWEYYTKGFAVRGIAYRNRPCKVYDINKYIEEEENGRDK